MTFAKKILSTNDLTKRLAFWRRNGRKIAFTNGCFDLLHFGHVQYLVKAKRGDRILVVGLNSDASVRRIKGKNRPITRQKERAAVLAALECVDYVTVFNEDTPLKLIKRLKPDILVKGADWRGKTVVGENVVKSYGGKVELVRYLDQYSTTAVIKKIKKS